MEANITSQEEDTSQSMLYVTFNQDASCFAIGTETGFRIYSSYPFKDNFYRNMNGGIGIIEMLYRTNILALVGGGKNPKYAPNKVIIWDDHQGKVIGELRFMSYVKNVKLKRDKIFIVTEPKIYVFTFNTFELLIDFETANNPKGLIAVSSSNNNSILAFPEKETIGSVMIKNFDSQKEIKINAHQSNLSCISLSQNGNLLATASEKGTLIRVYNTETKDLIKELRRGAERADIYSISFDKNCNFLAVSSDRKTIHIFSLKGNEENKEEEGKNQTSVFGKITSFFGMKSEYFNSEWSCTQFRINDLKSICAFGPDNCIFAITIDGKYYQASFDPKIKGDCKKIQEKNIFN